MTVQNFHHLGILVVDVGAARKRFSEVLGLTFTQHQQVKVDLVLPDGSIQPSERNVCFSLEGPPYYELVQAGGIGPFDLALQAEGLHHIGFYEDDVDARVKELAGHGVNWEVSAQTLDGSRMHFAYLAPADVHGVRLEVVWSGRREWLQSLLASARAERS